MAQPSNLPRWSDTVSADPTRVFQPTSGKADVGWDEGERPAAEHINWLLWTIYLWCSYLKNLNTEALTWTVLQTFGASVAVTGTVTATGVITGSTLHALNDVLIDDDLNVVDDAAIGGDLGVVGATVLAGVNCTGLTASAAVAGASVAATGAVTGATGTFSGAVSATDHRFSTARNRWFYATTDSASDPTATWGPESGTTEPACKYNSTGTDPLYVRVPVESGETIVSITVEYDNTDGSHDGQFALMRRTNSGGSTLGATGGSSTLTHGAGRTTSTATYGTAVAADAAFNLQVFGSSGISSGALKLYRIGVNYTRP